MKKLIILSIVLLATFLCLNHGSFAQNNKRLNRDSNSQNTDRLTVVAGSSLIADIIDDLTAHNVDMNVLIPGTSCPGHNDIKAVDVAFASRADLMIIHPFQARLSQVTDIINKVNNSKLKLIQIETNGSWLIPLVQKDATEKIATVLAGSAQGMSEAIITRVNNRINRLEAADKSAQTKLKAIKGLNVVVSDMQAEFVGWAGLEILATYDRPENMTPRDVAKIITELDNRPISGVIDNYQSGPEAGLPLSRELNVPQITISNFPGWTDDTLDYFSLLSDNVERLVVGLVKTVPGPGE